MRNKARHSVRIGAAAVGVSLFVAGIAPGIAMAQESGKPPARREAAEADIAARQLLARAQDLITGNEAERGVKMLETIYEQYPQSPVRFHAYLALGKHYIAARDHAKAIGFLRNSRSLEGQDREVPEAMRDVYLESLYLMGVAYFETRQYGSAFPVLRRITDDFPNTVWANQSYYYIGMCHFAEENWNKAIEALALVGTFVDPNSPTIQYVEAGRRFFVKVSDSDLPVLARLGQKVVVTVQAKSGDKEKIECVPLPGNNEIYIGSIPTDLGNAKPGDNVLQVIGGDTITTTYIDNNDKDGKKDVARASTTRVVSTGVLSFTLGDQETHTATAFLGQPLFVSLQDNDLDKTPQADTATVRIVSRYKAADEDSAIKDSTKQADLTKALASEAERYKIRDEVTLTLTEIGKEPFHSGKFIGKVEIVALREDQPVDKTDKVLSAALNDEVVAYYNDELHIGGETPREVTETALVVSEIENRPRATQYVVGDAVVAARKNLVEATAFLELGRIFKSMGLMKGAKEKADEGLQRVDAVIRTQSQIPASLNEQAFKTKWELQLVKDDFNAAIATCELFNRLYPESPFVDQALMGIGQVKMADKRFDEAIQIFRRVLSLASSQSKAEAQFRIAEATEQGYAAKPGSTGGVPEAAIAQYKLVAERYRDSEFAGPSLAKLVDYYIETKDYTQANDLLSQVFQDYPDASFLDSMLLKWVMVSFRMGDFQRAHDKCSQLLFEYPESRFAERAKAILPRIEERLKK